MAQQGKLLEAAISGDLQAAKDALHAGCDIEERGDWEMTPLHWAAQNNRFPVAKWLVENQAQVNSFACDKGIPLEKAVYWGSMDVAKYLVERGAHVCYQKVDGATCTHVAVMAGNMAMVDFLLDHGARPTLKMHNRDHKLPYDLAVEMNRDDMAQKLNPDTEEGSVKVGMVSARFNGGPVETMLREAHQIVAEKRNLPLRMVSVDAGESFGDKTLAYLNEVEENKGIIFAACTSTYGEKTASAYSSHEEIKYIAEYSLTVVPLIFERPYPPKPPAGPTHPYDQDNIAGAYIKKVFKPSVLAKDCTEMNALDLADFIEQRMRGT